MRRVKGSRSIDQCVFVWKYVKMEIECVLWCLSYLCTNQIGFANFICFLMRVSPIV